MALAEVFITSSGVPVRIMDDCYAGISAEELQRRRARVREIMDRIAYKKALADAQAAEVGGGTVAQA